MKKYDIRIEIPKGKVSAILDRLTAAQSEIYACYNELERLGVVTIKEETANSD